MLIVHQYLNVLEQHSLLDHDRALWQSSSTGSHIRLAYGSPDGELTGVSEARLPGGEELRRSRQTKSLHTVALACHLPSQPSKTDKQMDDLVTLANARLHKVTMPEKGKKKKKQEKNEKRERVGVVEGNDDINDLHVSKCFLVLPEHFSESN